jgi:hypothetical protein
LWTIEIEKIDKDTVFVTTSFEKTIINKSKSARENCGYYSIPELQFQNGPAKILDCTIEDENNKIVDFDIENQADYIKAATKKLRILPDRTAKLWGKATQYRRTSDVIFEVFKTPAINPEIEVIISEVDFEHKVEFGTEGDVTKSKYANRYTLSGVYFPGQYMFVKWWPKKIGHPTA